ncbi:MAG: amidohydrolase family protein [Geobacter sp.]|nr:amidohydrolase family protein [Geobacter sp.]
MSNTAIYTASWLINPDVPPIEGGAILVSDGLISAVGAVSELKRQYSAPLIEYPGCAIMPGFVNAHTHLELTHFPAWRLRTNIDYNPRRFTDWIIQLIKIARGLNPKDYPPSIQEGVRMCLESGTTAVGEIVSNAALGSVYAGSMLTGRLYFELLGQDSVRFNDKLEAALTAIGTAKSKAGLMEFGLSPHSPYTIGEEHLATITKTALSGKLPLSIHLSESAAESDFIFGSSGPLAQDFYPFVGWERYLSHPHRCSSTELLDRHGLLTPDTLAVHCVHVSLADARLLKERGVSIALCPRSNDKLDVGTAPVALFNKFGIPLALGTDSLASNDSLSMWDEMRYALDHFAEDLSAEDVFRMATSGAAAALKLSAGHGSLEAGKRGDFQVVANCGDVENGLIERVVRRGRVQDVYVGGVCYTG